ncbi:MAG: PIN domain-containing protein [Thermoanaerobaculia bacterium]
MSVLVDTSVWSLALRRRSPGDGPAVRELRELVEEARVRIIGAIRQEILSGIREVSHFESLRDHLSAFPDLELSTIDHVRAAEFFNICRRHGVQGSNTDFLICAAAERHGLPIFTTDGDFEDFALHLPIEIHPPRTHPAP